MPFFLTIKYWQRNHMTCLLTFVTTKYYVDSTKIVKKNFCRVDRTWKMTLAITSQVKLKLIYLYRQYLLIYQPILQTRKCILHFVVFFSCAIKWVIIRNKRIGSIAHCFQRIEFQVTGSKWYAYSWAILTTPFLDFIHSEWNLSK